jgi:hypothetical protein
MSLTTLLERDARAEQKKLSAVMIYLDGRVSSLKEVYDLWESGVFIKQLTDKTEFGDRKSVV